MYFAGVRRLEHGSAARGPARRKRSVQVVAGFAAVLLGITACSASKSGDSNSGNNAGGDPSGGSGGGLTTAKVDIVADLSGAGQALGAGGADGFDTAVKAAAAAGGIKIVTKRYDSQSDPNAAQVAFRSAIADKPAAILFTGLSTSFTAGFTLLSSAGIPVLATTQTPDALKQKWFFTPSALPQASGNVWVAAAAQALGNASSLSGKTVAIESVNIVGATAEVPYVKAAIQRLGGTVGDYETHDYGVTSFASQAQKIVSSKADAVVTIEASDQVTVTKALLASGFSGPIIAGVGGASDATFKTIGADNYYAIRDVLSPEPGDKAYANAKKYGTTASAPLPYYMWGYAMGQVAAKAFAKAKSTSPDDVIAAIHAMGPITPDNYVASLNFSSTQSGVTAYQAYTWDKASGKAVKFGDHTLPSVPRS